MLELGPLFIFVQVSATVVTTYLSVISLGVSFAFDTLD